MKQRPAKELIAERAKWRNHPRYQERYNRHAELLADALSAGLIEGSSDKCAGIPGTTEIEAALGAALLHAYGLLRVHQLPANYGMALLAQLDAEFTSKRLQS